MPLNTEKIDDAALALLYLTLHDGSWAWKSLDWDALGRLHDKGMIDNPASKRKSVAFPEEGLERRRRCLRRCSKSSFIGWVERSRPPKLNERRRKRSPSWQSRPVMGFARAQPILRATAAVGSLDRARLRPARSRTAGSASTRGAAPATSPR